MKIETIASRVRRNMVRHAKDNGFPKSLEGLCAIASFNLFLEFQKHGIKTKLVVIDFDDDCSHCFLIYNDKIVDITATQFNKKSVIVLPLNKREGESFWKIGKTFNSSEKFIDFLKRSGWCKEQIP